MNDVLRDLTIAIVPSVISSVITFILSRRKYKTEVETGEIANLKEALEFYEKVIEDTNKKLTEYMKIVEENRVEIYNLRTSIQKLLEASCVDTKCRKRKRLNDDEVRDYLNIKGSSDKNEDK